MTTFIAEHDAAHRNPWTEGFPCLSWGGATAAEAVTRLCEAHDIDPATLACRYSKGSMDRMEFITATATCPSCKGSGRYVGLSSIEDCETCCGGGRV